MAWTFQPNFTIRDDQTTFGNLIMDSSVVPIIEDLIIDILQDRCDVTKYGDLLDNKVFTNESYSAAQSEYEVIKNDISEFNHILGGLATFDGILKVAGNSVQYIAGSQSWIQSYINLKNEAGMLYKRIKSNKGYYNLNPTKEAEWDRRYTEVMSTITRADEHNRMVGLAMERYNADIAKGVSMREARDEAVTALRNSGVPEEFIRQKFGLMAAVQVDSTQYEAPVETTNINTSENNYLITAEFMRSTLDKIEKLPTGSDNQFMARVQIGFYFMKAMQGPNELIMLKSEVIDFFEKGLSYPKTPENKDLAAKHLNWLVNVACYEPNQDAILKNAMTVKKDMIDSFFTSLATNGSEDDIRPSRIHVTSNVLCKWYEDILLIENPSIKTRALINLGLWMIKTAQRNSILLDSRTVQVFNSIANPDNTNNVQLESCVSNIIWALTRTYQIQFDSADITVDVDWPDRNIYMKESDNQKAFANPSQTTHVADKQQEQDSGYVRVTTQLLKEWISFIETSDDWGLREIMTREIAEYLCMDVPYCSWYKDDAKLLQALYDFTKVHKNMSGTVILKHLKPFIEHLHTYYSEEYYKENFNAKFKWLSEINTPNSSGSIPVNHNNLLSWYYNIGSYSNLDTQAKALASLGDLVVVKLMDSKMSIPYEHNRVLRSYHGNPNASLYIESLKDAVTSLIDLTMSEQFKTTEHWISETELHSNILYTNESKFK